MGAFSWKSFFLILLLACGLMGCSGLNDSVWSPVTVRPVEQILRGDTNPPVEYGGPGNKYMLGPGGKGLVENPDYPANLARHQAREMLAAIGEGSDFAAVAPKSIKGQIYIAYTFALAVEEKTTRVHRVNFLCNAEWGERQATKAYLNLQPRLATLVASAPASVAEVKDASKALDQAKTALEALREKVTAARGTLAPTAEEAQRVAACRSLS